MTQPNLLGVLQVIAARCMLPDTVIAVFDLGLAANDAEWGPTEQET